MSVAGADTEKRTGFVARLAAISDGAILRVAFWSLLAGTASILYLDYQELSAAFPLDPGLSTAPLTPILPPVDPSLGPQADRPPVTTSPDVLGAPLEIVLTTGGELRLTGSFDVGSATRFAEEIEARGEYVETVVLDSPGGSVLDALTIGQLVADRGYATFVPAGALCASSCPIVFASGAERYATPESAIGVHQVYAAALPGNPAAMLEAAGLAMSEAQRMTARITRHLSASGVDPALWLHALETPPDRLYYFSGEEMIDLALATELLAPGAPLASADAPSGNLPAAR